MKQSIPPIDPQFVSDAMALDEPPSAEDIAEMWLDNQDVDPKVSKSAVNALVAQINYYL